MTRAGREVHFIYFSLHFFTYEYASQQNVAQLLATNLKTCQKLLLHSYCLVYVCKPPNFLIKRNAQKFPVANQQSCPDRTRLPFLACDIFAAEGQEQPKRYGLPARLISFAAALPSYSWRASSRSPCAPSHFVCVLARFLASGVVLHRSFRATPLPK